MNKYSKDDLIRKRMVRLIIWGISIIMIVIGSKHVAINGTTWEGVLIGAFGLILSIMLKDSYENLLKEKDALVSGDEQ